MDVRNATQREVRGVRSSVAGKRYLTLLYCTWLNLFNIVFNELAPSFWSQKTWRCISFLLTILHILEVLWMFTSKCRQNKNSCTMLGRKKARNKNTCRVDPKIQRIFKKCPPCCSSFHFKTFRPCLMTTLWLQKRRQFTPSAICSSRNQRPKRYESSLYIIRTLLHRASVSTQCQCCSDTYDFQPHSGVTVCYRPRMKYDGR